VNLEIKFAILKKFRNQADFAMTVREHESKVSAILHGRRKLRRSEAELWRDHLECDPAILKPVTIDVDHTNDEAIC
jgi:hypothetical protein